VGQWVILRCFCQRFYGSRLFIEIFFIVITSSKPNSIVLIGNPGIPLPYSVSVLDITSNVVDPLLGSCGGNVIRFIVYCLTGIVDGSIVYFSSKPFPSVSFIMGVIALQRNLTLEFACMFGAVNVTLPVFIYPLFQS
jgi:hypothetical protein